jgi:hypothetical protein
MWLYRDLADHPWAKYFAWICLPMTLCMFSAGFVKLVGPKAVGKRDHLAPSPTSRKLSRLGDPRDEDPPAWGLRGGLPHLPGPGGESGGFDLHHRELDASGKGGAADARIVLLRPPPRQAGRLPGYLSERESQVGDVGGGDGRGGGGYVRRADRGGSLEHRDHDCVLRREELLEGILRGSVGGPPYTDSSTSG